jgi:hypothetical protein
MKFRWEGIDGEGETLWDALCEEYNQRRGCSGILARYEENEAKYMEGQFRNGDWVQDRYDGVCKNHVVSVVVGWNGWEFTEERLHLPWFILCERDDIESWFHDEEDCVERATQEYMESAMEGGWLFDHIEKSDDGAVAEQLIGELPPVESFFSDVYGDWLSTEDKIGECESCGEWLVKTDLSEHGGIGECGRCGMPVPSEMQEEESQS